jgi:uncharacterized repeat protein (TIGR03803 family)
MAAKSHLARFLEISLRPVLSASALAVILVLIVGPPSAQAQTFDLLHTFSGQGDGGSPSAGLSMDRAGDLYGTTTAGGAGHGTVFKLAHVGSGWTLSTIYTFHGGNDGGLPQGRVVFGPDGTLYGTTSGGGSGGRGTVFNLRPPASVCRSVQCPWNETVLYSFTGGHDGGTPVYVDVTFDAAGNIYGTTGGGGLDCTSNGACGVVFKLSRSGSSWIETVLYSFGNFPDGFAPYSGVTFDSAGNLYGTTYYGGTHSFGIVYELTPSGSGWTETILHNLNGSSDGANPYGGIAVDQAGNLYGTTTDGGSQNGGGTVFQLQPSGGTWTFNVIYSANGFGQFSDTPTLDAAGNVYATGEGGGAGLGNVFKLTPGSHGWTYVDLHDFNIDNLDQGYFPFGSVLLDTNSNLYGTALQGGNMGQGCVEGCGVVWEVQP